MQVVDVNGIGPQVSGDAQELYPWPDDAVGKNSPWIRCNMVMTLDGVIAGPDGRSGSIASPVDKRVFLELRRDCDVILVGAGTARDEGYRPSVAPIALVSGSLDLSPDMPLFAQATASTPRSIVITSREAESRAPQWLREQADVIACGQASVDVRQATAALHARGLDRIHCEGGPALMTSLIVGEVLDELLLTVTPILLGGGRHLIDDTIGAVTGTFTQVLTEDGTLLIRLALDYSSKT
ncbi:MAG: dihydrofolate reductase family protein [Candidatus Nanopelagicales bacterium]